jgi:hypothetical protein
VTREGPVAGQARGDRAGYGARLTGRDRTYAARAGRGCAARHGRSLFRACARSRPARAPVTGKPMLLLNNKPLFQNGTLDQGWWPESLLTPPSEEGDALATSSSSRRPASTWCASTSRSSPRAIITTPITGHADLAGHALGRGRGPVPRAHQREPGNVQLVRRDERVSVRARADDRRAAPSRRS